MSVQHPRDGDDGPSADSDALTADSSVAGSAELTGAADDATVARAAAAAAGQLLLEIRTELGFTDPAALRSAGDRRSHELLTDLLTRWRPGDAVLSEEGVDDDVRQRRRLSVDRVWIIDPLDGTREFSEEGRADWAVHVALWQRSGDPATGTDDVGQLVAGAVALPAQGTVFGTDATPAYPSGHSESTVGRPWLRLAVSRTRAPAFLSSLAEELDAELVSMGSAGAKVCAVMTGEVDAYVHAGGQYEWDSAAPVAVATALGLHACRIDGSALRYNRPDPLLPDLVVCRSQIAERLLAALDRLDVGAQAHPTSTGVR